MRSPNRVGDEEISEEISALARYLQPSHHDQLAELLSTAAFAIPHDRREDLLRMALADAPEGSSVADEFAEALKNHDEMGYEVFFELASNDEAVEILSGHTSIEDLIKLLWESPEDIPAWVTLDYRDTHPRDWLVHCTDSPREIFREGFRRGVEDIQRIALTTHLPAIEKKYPGFNFAYEPEYFARYAYSMGSDHCRYGRNVVLLRAPYVAAYHSGDEEPQSIFWGPSASDIVWLDVAERGYYRVELDVPEDIAAEDYDPEDWAIEAASLPELIDELEERYAHVPRVHNPFVPRALLERLTRR